MFRKILIAIAALAAIGIAAFTTSLISISSAQAFNNHRHHNYWRPAVRFHSPSYNYANCYVRRVIHTPYGPRVQTVNICY